MILASPARTVIANAVTAIRNAALKRVEALGGCAFKMGAFDNSDRIQMVGEIGRALGGQP